jgi:hypothetical protein
MSVSLASLGGLLMLPKELPVHGDEQLLTVLAEARIAADGLDHVEAGLVVPTRDRQVAEQSGQGARLQIEEPFQVGDLGGDRQRSAALPLRYRGVADADRVGNLALREAALLATPPKHPAELFPLLSWSQARHLVTAAVQALAHSIAQVCERAGNPALHLGSTSCHLGHIALVSTCVDLRLQGWH